MLLYEKEYDLRVSDFDKNDCLKPFAILDAFQTVADFHAKRIGMGYDDLIKNGIVWVLLRTRYDVLKPISFGTEKVILRTWPHEAGRADYDRDYQILSTDNEVLINGSSKWCLLNIKTRRIVFGGGVNYPDGEYYLQKNYPDGLKKIADFSIEGALEVTALAGERDLDHNGHVNNARYAEFILDALEGEKIRSIEINYLNEMIKGEYTLYVIKEDNKRLIKGFSNQKESFRAVVEVL